MARITDPWDLARWLLDNGGPVIRFRMTVDFYHEQDLGVVTTVLRNFLRSEEVGRWLSRVTPAFGAEAITSDEPTAFVNVMGKLAQLGMRGGLQPFDTLTLPFRVWLTEGDGRTTSSTAVLVADMLSIARYQDIWRVDEILQRQLQVALSQGGAHLTLYDILAFLRSEKIMGSPQLRDGVEQLVGRICDGLSGGTEEAGVSTMAPCALGALLDGKPRGLQLVEILASSTSFRESPAFIGLLDTMEEYRTEQGTYMFPSEWLEERAQGYWICGDFMALDTGERSPGALELESTFWALMIRRAAGVL